MSDIVKSRLNSARRRLIAQLFLNRLAICFAVALALSLIWILAEPFLIETAIEKLKWYIVGTMLALGTIVAAVWTYLSTPTKIQAAIEFDSRFQLSERVTTALGLDAELLQTAAGQAVLADADQSLNAIKVNDKFPVKPRWHALLTPAFASLIALAVYFAAPMQLRQALAGEEPIKKLEPINVVKQEPNANKKALTKTTPKDELDRQNKSDKLKELEQDLEKLGDKFDREREPADQNKEKAREKVTELTKLEDKMKKFNEEKIQKLAQLDQKMQELDKLNRDPDFNDGPAKKLNDAMAKGDLKKAKEEVDELKKKAKKNEMTNDDQQKLAKQLDKMKNELERLSRDDEKKKKLEEMIKKAKEDGKDADSLERELDSLKKETQEASKEMEELAEKIQKAQQALEKGDMQDLADQLEKVGNQMKEIEGELQDLEDVQQYLQNLKQEKKKACGQCEGDGNCKGDKEKESDKYKWTPEGNVGSGKRGEKEDETSYNEEKIKSLFDPRGKKVYGGGVKGQAFSKKSTTELGQQIQEAVQEAPQAADAQRLPRDAKDNVKEYFENLGGNKK